MIAGMVALLASLGGGWGSALGQTAGPPPTRLPSGVDGSPSYPVVTPPPAAEYRLPGTSPTGVPEAATRAIAVATPMPAAVASPTAGAPSAGEAATALATSPPTLPPSASGNPAAATSASDTLAQPPTLWALAGLALLSVAGLATWYRRRHDR